MKKRKILYLIPFAALVLSGCTFQEGFDTVKTFFGDNIVEPVKTFFENLFGKKKEEQKEDEGKDDSQGGGGQDQGGGGQSGDQTPKHAGTLADPFTGEDACIVAQKLENKATSAETYYIQGTVQKFDSKETFNPSYGNFTFYIENDFECYRCLKGPAKAKFSSADDLKVGDTVIVNAKLKKWYETSETEDGYIYSINGVEQKTEDHPEPPMENKTLAEIVNQTNPEKDHAYVSSATISSWADNKGNKTTEVSEYGNMFITDGVNEVYVYGASGVTTDLVWDSANNQYKMNNSHQFKTNSITKDLQVGDKIDFYGIYFLYNAKPQMSIIITGSETPSLDVESVSLGENEDSLELEVGKADVQLHVTVLPAKANQEVVWSTNDATVAEVSQTGLVHAVGQGQTTIRVESAEDSTKYAECTVSVSVAEGQLDGVAVTTMPKTTYYEGETLDLSDMVLTLHYSNGDSETTSTGYSTNIALDHQLTQQDTKLVVTYGGIPADAITLTILEAPLTQTSVYKIENAESSSAADGETAFGWLKRQSGNSVVTGVQTTSYVYPGASSGTAWKSDNLIKVGKAGEGGRLVLTLDDNVVVSKVTLKGFGWKDTLVVNVGTSSSAAGAFTVAGADTISGTPSTVNFNLDLYAVGALKIESVTTALLITEIDIETTAASVHKVSFEANGQNVTNLPYPVAVESGTVDLTELGEPSREGFEFSGWSLTSSGSAITSVTLSDSDVTVYALWTEKATINYVKCSLEEGELLITTLFDGESYYLPTADATSTAPAAVKFTDVKNIETTQLWTVTKNSSGNWEFTNANGNYLYITSATNNGVRINNTKKSWKQNSDGSLECVEVAGRYLGIYQGQDWRSYNSATHSNYKESATSIAFYKAA